MPGAHRWAERQLYERHIIAAMCMWMDGRRLGNGPAILWPDDVVGLEADILSFLRRTSYPTLTGEDGMAKACFCSQLEAQVPGISDLYRMSFVEVLQWL